MKNEWPQKTLGELADVIAGQSPDGSCYNSDGQGMPFYQGKKEFGDKFIGEPTIWTTEVTRIALDGDVLISVRAPVGPVNFATKEICIGRGLAAIRSRNLLNRNFLFYFLLSKRDEIEGTQGAVFASINKGQIEQIKIAAPSLPEQQRIVGILDEAFEEIAAAKARAEKNLQNARALLESHLQAVFAKRGEGWTMKKIGEIARKSLGKMLDKAKNQGELRPYLRNLNVRWFAFDLSDLSQMRFLDDESDKFTAIRGDVMICEGGYPGRAAIWDEDYPIHFQKAIHRVRFHEREHGKWFVYFLYVKDKSGELRRHFTGTGIQHFTGETLGRFKIPIPPLLQLRGLISRFDELFVETRRLESLYQRKLIALDELKNSLLHQAFSGQLAAGESVHVVSSGVPFPVTIPNISTTDLHAGILAMACQLHEKNGKLDEFTHVKAEKIAHMIEARLGIDLGRQPVKDAAGPNDFNHLKKVEHRARMAKYFDFRRVDGVAYRMEKLRGFDRLIDKTRAALGGHCANVDHLLRWMLRLNVQRAEIVATIYAAWNNLLLDGQQPTDEQIVFESRENWHPEKLNIERKRFFSAVQWLRDEDVVPEGKGKRVIEKGK